MIVAKSRKELDRSRANLSGTLALVPTMGALHDGHLSLCKLAKKKSDNTGVSIFVNPTQFGQNEDLDTYPRALESDLEALEKLEIDLVYVPSVSDIYPDSMQADLKAGEAAKDLETEFRPHFFDGVVSVVYKLFDHIKPDTAIFGEKDYQQLMVIREMVEQKNLPIQILGSETIRDDMGLALSSRNSYLSADELGIARLLNQIMYGVAYGITEGIEPQKACENAGAMLLESGFDKIDYIAYKPAWSRILVAAWLGKTRLIDNCALPDIKTQNQDSQPSESQPILLPKADRQE